MTTLSDIVGPDALDGVPETWVERVERDAPAIMGYHEAQGADPRGLLTDLLDIGRRAGDQPVDRYAMRTQRYWSIGAVTTAAMLYRHPDRAFPTADDFGAFVESVMEGYHESEVRWREMAGEPTPSYLARFGHRPPGLAEAERKRRERLAWLYNDAHGHDPSEV